MESREALVWAGAHTHNPEQTREAGAEFAACLKPGDVVALNGDLGSGKTTFVKGMAGSLGLGDQVSSPSFALIHEYDRPPRFYHMDCYRETALERWRQLGLYEYFDGEAITVIEWAENIAPLLPARTIHLTFFHGSDEDERIIKVHG